MKKIVCLLLLGVCLFGCKEDLSKISYVKEEENLTITVEVEYIDNHIEKITEKHYYTNVDVELREELFFDDTGDKFLKNKNDGSEGFRNGINWRLNVLNEENTELEKRIVINVDNLNEEDKKLTAEVLKYYDYDDVEKTRMTLEKAGFTLE